MGTKVISIMDDAYELLVKNKKAGESFSEVIRRVVPKKKNIMDCAGLWSYMSDEEFNRLKKDILNVRKELNADLAKRIR
jgi:predicted CopG family antitoxin